MATRQQQYAISTVNLYDSLAVKWSDNRSILSRELFDEIITAITIVLHSKNIQPRYNWGNDVGGLLDYVFTRYPARYKESRTPNHFPIPPYIVFHRQAGAITPDMLGGTKQYYGQHLQELLQTYTVLYLEDDSYSLRRGDAQYDFFFALQLSLIDIMQVDDFLRYHLSKSFRKNTIEYSKFLNAISIKHKKYLGEDFVTMINKFQSELIETESNNKEVVDTAENEITLRKKVLAMKYLFDELEINNDKIAIAEFMKLITGKEASQKTKDGNIYKFLKNPLPLGNKALRDDLSHIRPYFEALGLENIIKKINKEITTK